MAQSATNGFTVHETATRLKLGSDGVWRCHYHGTQIASLNNNTILHLNTGGYNTRTTCRRMNQFASELNLPFQVSQRDGELLFSTGTTESAFSNHIVVDMANFTVLASG